MRHFISLSVLAVVAFPLSAGAEPDRDALLTQVHGQVLVDVGEGFAAVSQDIDLRNGDRVMVAKDGGAVLDFGGDCSFPLESPSMTTIEKTACSVTTQDQDGGNLGGGGVSGVSAAGSLGVAGVSGATSANKSETPVSP